MFQLTLVMVYGLAILGLNLLTGFNGQFSLGHSAFYGIGAYTAAILMDRWDVPYYCDLAGGGRGLLCRRLPVRLPGAAAARASISRWRPSRWRPRCRRS